MKEGLPKRLIAPKCKSRRRGGPRRTSAVVELERLKACLLLEHTRAVADPAIQSWLKRAANDAASIAWATTYPLLVLPVLLDEKMREACRKAELQKSIYVRSQSIVALAE
jgi:hypothetical protein